MSAFFDALGENYFVRPEDRPDEALQQAARLLGREPAAIIRNGWGGPLHHFIHHPNVRDIIVQHEAQVWIRDRYGAKAAVPIRLNSDWIDYLAYRWRYAAAASRQAAAADPLANFRHTLFFPDLGGGIRYQYVGSAFSALGSSIYIRRLPAEPVELDSLVANGTLPREAADMLIDFLKAKTPIIISGQTGSGKTTLLGALVNELQKLYEPINLLLVEKSHEIPLNRPAYRWEEDADGRVGLAHLASHATQMGLEWLVLGECTGAEAYFVLKAFTQGVPVLTTLHAANATAGLRGLAMLALEHVKEPSLLPNLLRALAEEAVISVHIELNEREDGSMLGQVTGIEEMISVSGDKPVVNPIWSRKPDPETGFGRLVFNRGSLAQLSDTTRLRFRVAAVDFPPPQLMADPTRNQTSPQPAKGFFARK